MAKPVAGNLETFLVGYVLGEHENASQISPGKLAEHYPSEPFARLGLVVQGGTCHVLVCCQRGLVESTAHFVTSIVDCQVPATGK
jgi:hypothetical protein